MSLILPRSLYLGCVYDISSSFLREHKIKRIINCCFKTPNHVDLGKYDYYQIKIFDSKNQKIIGVIDKVYDILYNEPKITLINCRAGISRSATIVIGVLMKRYGISLKDSFDYVHEKRYIINPNQGFMLQLQEYDKICKRDREVKTKNLQKMKKNLNSIVTICKNFL